MPQPIERGRKRVWIVFSIDHDQQQPFADMVHTDSEENAEAIILHTRPYIQEADAWSLNDLRELIEYAQRVTPEETAYWLKTRWRHHNGEESA